MKLLIYCLAILLLTFKTAVAQYEYSKGMSVKEGNLNKFDFRPFGLIKDKKSIYQLTYNNNQTKINVNQFDRRDYKLQSEKSFALPQFGGTTLDNDNFEYSDLLITTKNHSYFVYPREEYFFEFNTDGEFGEKRAFSTNIDKKNYKVDKFHGVFMSNDSTKVLIPYRATDKSNKSQYCIVFRVFDENFSLLNSYVVSTPDELWGSYKVYEFGVNNQGDCFMLEKENVQSVNYQLTQIRKGKISRNKLAPEDLITLNAGIAFDATGELYIGGVYGIEKGSLGQGFYVLKYTSENESQLYTSEFSKELMVMYETPEIKDWITKNYASNNIGIHNLSLNNFSVSKEGNITLIAEKRYYTKNHKSGQPVYYEDIVLSQFNRTGKENWTRRLPKSGWEYSNSEHLFKYKSRIRMNEKYCYIICYDHKNNAEVSANQHPITLERNVDSELSVTAIYQVNLATGNAEKMTIEKEKFPNNDLIQLLDETVLITCLKNGKWVELTFPD